MVIRVTSSGNPPGSQQQTEATPTPFRLFEELFNDWALRSTIARRRQSWVPPVDIFEQSNNMYVRTEIPGIDEKAIELKVDGHILTIKAERKPEPEDSGYTYHQVESSYGTFTRSFELPDSIDLDKISASAKNGVLLVTVPLRAEVRPRDIKITQS